MTSDNILVAIKSRPFITREKKEKLTSQWNIQQKIIFQIDETSHRIGEPYSFDHIFAEDSTNESVYNAVVEPLIKSCLEGFNSTIFAYGQTSSGKTHTMMGSDNASGIIQLAVNDIFNQLQLDKKRRYLISCSYFEIYNEKIRDLLDNNEKELKIREDFHGNTFINSKEEVVTVPEQVYELMNLGNKTRKIGCTNINERSSRSHTIFRFTIESTDNSIENGPVQVSQLNLVDLAGSERIAHTKAEGKRLQEGVNINKSLSVLGNVIRQLSDCERYISYRDSKLTRLLQQALGGNAKSLIIATITLAAGEETKSTLEFAQRAKAIKNKPIVNEILSEPEKLKKYESVAAGYKKRLEYEAKRIEEMELRFQQEKVEREKEIVKLKQQFKLINLFAKGPQPKKTESKIPRRHTVGHYGSTPLLETIPELSVLPSTYNRTQDDLGQDYNQGEFEFDETLPDSEFMKLILEESLTNVLISKPELSEDTLRALEFCSSEPLEIAALPVETLPETPPSFLRKRLKSLEESYTTLKEFTKLEAECKEKEKDYIQDLVREKERLLKDCVDLNEMLKLERLEKEKLKLTHEEELALLKTQLEIQKKENTELAFRLGQIETENDLLKVVRGQELIDHQFLLEERTRNYENQLDYLREEIQRINEQTSTEVQDAEIATLQQQIKSAEDENRCLGEDLMKYKETIKELEKKLSEQEEHIQEEVTIDLMSISTQTEKSEIEADMEQIKSLMEEKVNLKIENDLLQEKIDIMLLNKESEIKTLQGIIYSLKIVNEKYLKEKANEEELQMKLNARANLIEQLNKKLMFERERNFSLNEEKENCLRDVSVLTELLSLGNEETLSGLIEEHQGLLDLYESQLKSNAKQMIMDCDDEIDQFMAYLFELRDITQDEEFQEEIDVALLSIQINEENFINLLENFSMNLNNTDNPVYTESSEKLNSLNLYVREKLNYMSYTESHNKQLQSKIYKQVQYLEQLNEIRERITSDKNKDLEIKELKDKITELCQLNTEECEKYQKEINDLELTIADLKLDYKVLQRRLEEKSEEEYTRQCIDSNQIYDLKSDVLDLTLETENLKTEINQLRSTTCQLTFERDELSHRLEESNKEIDDLKKINKTLIDGIEDSKKTIKELTNEIESLKKSIKDSVAEIEMEKTKNQDLNKQVKNLSFENVSLVTKIFDLENAAKDIKSSQSFELQKSFPIELSPKEIRRRKRQSIHDQRRGIDSRESGDAMFKDVNGVEKDVNEIEKELRETIAKLTAQVGELTSENDFLEFEVQGFIRELDDCKRHVDERDNEIEALKKQIEEAKVEPQEKAKDCSKCQLLKKHIKQLEGLHKTNMFKIVGLQTRIYDLQNTAKVDKINQEETRRLLTFKITKLEEKLLEKPPATETTDLEVQCDLLDYEELLGKYTSMKKLARIRREEGNLLRAKLGMKPDEPVE